MGVNWPWNWRLTVVKTIKMMLVRPRMTNFKMTVRADCAVSACSTNPLSIKALAHWLSVGRVSLWTGIRPAHWLPACKIKHFPFYHPGLFIGFWTASSRIPLLVTGANDFQRLIWIFWVCRLSLLCRYNVDCSQLMSWFDRYQLQVVYPTVEHCPERNLQHETSQTIFDTFDQSRHLLLTLHKPFFAFQLRFYLSWNNKA